jgi:SSS family solute:Na+ symporter
MIHRHALRRWSTRLRAIVLLSAGLPLAPPPASAVPQAEPPAALAWSRLPDLPDPVGVAGPFVGVCAGETAGGMLVVAGGANFPGRAPWDGGTKAWHDAAWVLADPAGEWVRADPLPRPLAYGVSASFGGRLWCIGGGDAQEHVASTMTVRWDADARRLVVDRDALPPLPRPVAFAAGTLVGSRLYVAGGQEGPAATEALATFWSIDLAEALAARDGAATLRWREHPSWPGPPRILPVLGSRDGHVYLVSGAAVAPAEDGTDVTRSFLADAYRFDPVSDTWSVRAPPPVPLVAAPGPAIPIGVSQLAFLPGDDGALFTRQQELADRHPGFPRTVLLYDTITDGWRSAGAVPETSAGRDVAAVVTTPAVPWRGRTVVATGETRPGVRTAGVLAVAPAAQPAVFGAVEWGVLVAYLVGLVGIGVACARGEHSTADYFLGGRRIPWWAAGISIFGTTLSAITYLSIPARAYATDWSMIFLNAGIVLVAPLVVGWYLPAFQRSGVTTAYEYLETRFDLSLRLFGATCFTLLQLARMGIVILLPAVAISAVTQIPVAQAIIAMGVLATLYTVLGGIEAVIWTDVLQVAVLLGGAAVAIAVALAGIDGGAARAFDIAAAADKLRLVQPSWDPAGDTLWVILVGALFSNALVPYTTDQSVIQRYLTTADERQAARAIWTNALIVIPATLLFFGVGTAIYCFYASHPDATPLLASSAELVPWFATTQLPTGFGGLVVAGIFAAAMSSLDSGMHSVSTVVTNDVVKRFWPQGSDASRLRIARGLVVILGVVGTATALWMARVQVPHFWDLVVTLMGLFGGPLSGVFFLGVFTRRVGPAHAWAGVTAAVAAVAWLRFGTTANGILAGGLGWATCVAVALLAAAGSSRWRNDRT